MAFVPEGQADSSQARSAWLRCRETPVPEGRSKSLAVPESLLRGVDRFVDSELAQRILILGGSLFPLDDLLGGCGTNADRPARRRGFHLDPHLKDSGERRSDTHEHDAPKDCDKKREPQAGRIHQTVKQQDVHDDGTENR
jgi:hypothetical protein